MATLARSKSSRLLRGAGIPAAATSPHGTRSGWSRIMLDEPIEMQPMPMGGSRFARIWLTNSSPADPQDPEDAGKTVLENPLTIVTKGGSNLAIVETPPKSSSPMHWTESVDYAIDQAGNPILELTDGTRRKLAPGDIVVQRATLHAWHNEHETEWTRVVFANVEAKVPQPKPEGLQLH